MIGQIFNFTNFIVGTIYIFLSAIIDKEYQTEPFIYSTWVDCSSVTGDVPKQSNEERKGK